MSTGSTKSREGLQQRRARHLSRAPALWFICGLAVVGGCGHAKHSRPTDLRSELATVTAEELFVLAVSYAHAGDLLRAEQYLSAARRRGYNTSSVVYWLVRVCVASSRYQSALNHSDDYLRDHPGDWSLRFVVASIHEALGDAARAQFELERIVEARPDEPLPHYRLAMLYRGRDSTQVRASEHFQRYLELDPNGPHAAEVRAALSEVVSVADAVLGPQQTDTQVVSGGHRGELQ